MQKKPFTELGLSEPLLKAVERAGYEEASPIQTAAIPVLLTGKDIIGQSQTGSGKTAAFALPAIEKVDPELPEAQVLILCPTRELALQVAEEVAKMAYFKKGVRELPIYGGQAYDRQIRGLKQGAHIIIGTPGRIIDHLEKGTLRMDHVRYIVLDEADRMLDMGFCEDIERILQDAPEDRQTVFFSATLPKQIKSMIDRFAKEPEHIRIESQQLDVPTIEQTYYEVQWRSKLEVLCRIIDMQNVKYGIIFVATKLMCDELCASLTARSYTADKLHGDMTQAMRERVMNRFRKRQVEFLVATDVAARGLDVDDIEVVFNYDLPQDPEDYVHRIGRTGRAGRSGRAITFVSGREIYKVQQIMRFTKGQIKREKVPSLNEVEEHQASALTDSLKTELEEGNYSRHDEIVDALLQQGHSATDIASALLHMLGEEVKRPAEKIAEDNQRGDRFQAGGDREPRERRDFGGDDRRGGYGDDRGGRFERGGFGDRDNRPPREPRRVDATSGEHGMTRLWMGVGRQERVSPGEIVGFIARRANIPGDSIGQIHIFDRHTFIDVAENQVQAVQSLIGENFAGRRINIRIASEGTPQSGGDGGRREGGGSSYFERRNENRGYGDDRRGGGGGGYGERRGGGFGGGGGYGDRRGGGDGGYGYGGERRGGFDERRGGGQGGPGGPGGRRDYGDSPRPPREERAPRPKKPEIYQADLSADAPPPERYQRLMDDEGGAGEAPATE